MAPMKSIVLVTLLVVVLAATQTEAQFGLINIAGNISCSPTGGVVANAITPTPPFPNALVELTCGGNVIALAITNGSGAFSIVLNPLQVPLSSLLTSCNLVVATPLSTCNATLPSLGFLQSPLQFAGIIFRGLLSLFNIVPAEFQLVGV